MTASAVTSLVVTLGVVISPTSGAESTTAADILEATSAGGSQGQARAAAVLDPAPPVALPQWQKEKPVTFEPKPEPKKKVRKKKGPPPLPTAAQFTIGTFNVLGSSHTSKGGKWPRMASGTTRVRWAAGMLSSRGVDVVGLQELQRDQLYAFRNASGFAVWPGEQAGPLGIENSLAWRTSEWTLDEAHTIQIPYFDGRLRPMPYVKLRHNETGRMAWFANFHNPASNSKRGNNDGHRRRAMWKEIELANNLWSSTGLPVFITGDMNEREVYFCAMTGNAPMIAANGGSHDGSCTPPPYPMPVDWIFGSENVSFSNYSRHENGRVSDHPLVAADVELNLLAGVSR